MEFDPLGVSGFQSLEDAKADAATRLYGLDAIYLRNGDEYAWVWPREHAARLMKNSRIEEVRDGI